MGSLSAKSALLERDVIATFNKTFKATGSHPLQKLATFVNSTKEIERHGGFGEVAEMREWTDTKVELGLPDKYLDVENSQFEATHKIHKKAILADSTGMVSAKMASVTMRGKMFPGKLVSDLIRLGSGTTIGKCYDGGAFFSTSHASVGNSGVQSNYLTGTGGDSTAHVKNDLAAGIAALRGMKDTQGVPMNDALPLNLFVVAPTGLETYIREALLAQFVNSTSNTDLGRADFFIDARLSDANDWWIFNLSDPSTLPFGIQELDPLKPVYLGDGSDQFYKTGYASYGAEWFGKAFYGWFQNAIQIHNS